MYSLSPSSASLNPAMDSKVSRASSPHPNKWWSEKTVAVVTGANKGIGFALVRQLAELGLTVVLTSRDIGKGQAAVNTLREQGLSVEFCRLDVTDRRSIIAFANWLQQRFGGLDILVNNAAVSFNDIDSNSVEHAETVIHTNYYGSKVVIEALLPLFRRSATVSRILNVSSRLGLLNKLNNRALRQLLQDEDRISEETIEQMLTKFLKDVKRGTWKEEGWPKVWTDYAMSKLALNAYSRILARQNEGHNLSVNCFCPGFTRTSMTRGQGCRTAEEAARVAAGLALLPPNELSTGKFFIWSTSTVYSKL